MATGTVYYWNGMSGWIKQTGVSALPTAQANDVMVLAADVQSGTIVQDASVTFTTTAAEPWLARNITVP